MKLGDIVTVTVTGKVVKREVYVDGKTRACVQDSNTNEYAIVIDDKD